MTSESKTNSLDLSFVRELNTLASHRISMITDIFDRRRYGNGAQPLTPPCIIPVYRRSSQDLLAARQSSTHDLLTHASQMVSRQGTHDRLQIEVTSKDDQERAVDWNTALPPISESLSADVSHINEAEAQIGSSAHRHGQSVPDAITQIIVAARVSPAQQTHIR